MIVLLALHRCRGNGTRHRLTGFATQLHAQVAQVAPLREDFAVLFEDAEIHMKMNGQRLGAPGIAWNAMSGAFEQEMTERFTERRGGVVDGLIQHFCGSTRIVRHRNKVAAHTLWQAFQKCGDLLFQQPRYQPVTSYDRHLVEGSQRHVQGDPVITGAGVKPVAERETGGVMRELGWKVVRLRCSLLPHQGFTREEKALGVALFNLNAPFFEFRAVGDVGRNLIIKKAENCFFIDFQTGIARSVREIIHFLLQLLVVLEERGTTVPIALHQRAANEQRARQHGVDGAVMHFSTVHHGESVNRCTHGGGDVRRFF